jgi:hypothetical protein
MSAQGFQTALARLIVEPDFRDAVRAAGAGALDDTGLELTLCERSRLALIAHDRGVDLNRTLHKGFRLGKLRAMLPLTCTLLTPARLAREVALFWQRCPPSSFYFLPEALQFCDFLAQRRVRSVYLAEVLAYERATLELERARVDAPPPQRVVFAHEPAALLGALAQGRRPRGVALCACVVVGSRTAAGPIAWVMNAR